jgi:MFS family permease
MPGTFTIAAEPPAASFLAGHHRRRGLIFLGLMVAFAGFTMSLQLGVNSNFVAQEMGLSGFEQGLLETVREMCGIVALGVLAILAGFPEPLVAAAMLALLGLGICGYAFVHDYVWLVLVSLVWSQGLHVWMPLPNSMALALAEPGRAGRRLGQVQAAGAAGAGLGLVAALVLYLVGVKIRPLFIVAGAAAILAAAACLGIPRAIKTPGPRLVFRRKYGLFYLLNFLNGWRKQIFVAFAGFLLVRMYEADLATMLGLWIAIQAIGWLAAPPVGRLIDRIGERRTMVFYFACVTLFFIGYAVIQNKFVLYAVYIVNGAFAVFSMALTTYVNRIAPPREHTPTLSMGVAMDHVAAVLMPLVGGLLWKFAGYQWTFFLGAGAAAMSVVAALRIPRHEPART